jgi:hippurate hydrolase
MPILPAAAALREEAAEWRHELHEHPQTSYEEEFASGFVAARLAEWGIPFKRGLAKTGVVATIEGRSPGGRALALRADMDALDITEEGDGLAYASRTPGKMHACGHDGHTAILLGVAKYLKDHRDFGGRVHLIFQPAEEGGAGAVRMMREGLFEEFPADAVYGLHNWPYAPVGTLATRAGPLLASADELTITVRGRGGHAAMPHRTVDPIVVGAHVVTALQSIVARNVDPVDQGVLTIANFNAGTGATNVIADRAVLTGTIRAFKPETRLLLERRAREVTEGVARALLAEAELRVREGGYAPTVNTARETAIAAAAAAAVLGPGNVDADVAPVMGAEDFGAYLTKVPGCFVFLGQGVPGDPASRHNQGLHTARYDFNDEIIPLAVSWFAKLVESQLPPG